MKKSDFYYEIPDDLIAQDPIPEREMSRLLILDRASGKTSHKSFKDIEDHLMPGDCLVLNDTRVIPARLLGKKEDTGVDIEFLLLHPTEDPNVWNVILKPGRRAKKGSRFSFAEGALKAEILSVEPDGNRLARFEYEGIFNEILDKAGIIPLPPYIRHSLKDPERYQTVYSRFPGSAAAPTAGLHFTKELLSEISDSGVRIAYVTLHVGIGTFRPVKADDITTHIMHSEYYEISADAARKVNETKSEGGRVIAVGTTSCRVLETAAAMSDDGNLDSSSGWTDIFIYPGYVFKVIDALITNFHLPESSLIMLVSAFAGHEQTMKAYKEAVEAEYRFFSFGDAMFIK